MSKQELNVTKQDVYLSLPVGVFFGGLILLETNLLDLGLIEFIILGLIFNLIIWFFRNNYIVILLSTFFTVMTLFLGLIVPGIFMANDPIAIWAGAGVLVVFAIPIGIYIILNRKTGNTDT